MKSMSDERVTARTDVELYDIMCDDCDYQSGGWVSEKKALAILNKHMKREHAL